MQLALALSLICAVIHTGQSLQCNQCANTDCTNTTSVVCAAGLTVCKTESIVQTGSGAIVNKTCAAIGDCFGFDMAYEVSVDLGFFRKASNQLCCFTDNCNFQTLAVPNTLSNGKVCRGCAVSSMDQCSICNTTLDCLGAENSCFSLTRTDNNMVFRGCMSKNLCSGSYAQGLVAQGGFTVTCRAPTSLSLALGVMLFGLLVTSGLVDGRGLV